MKKTKLMRAALLLLVLTLITSCFVGGTFAKYVTDGKSTDSARVAKWGVGITAEGTTFANTYTTDDGRVTGIAKSVISTENVVAPGTEGKMAAVKLSGTPEVAVKVSYEPVFNVENWTVATKTPYTFYCPLVIKVSTKLGNSVINGRDFDNKADFEKAVKNEIAAYSKVYGAGTDLSKVNEDMLSVSWAWPFEKTPDTDPDASAKYKQTDEYDTVLGNAVTAPTVYLEVTTTVTQID